MERKLIDTQSVSDLIESQIKLAVDQQVQHALSNDRWIESIEKQIVQYVQDRIVARFNNISNMPDLVETVKISVADLIDQGHLPGVDKFVDQGLLQVSVNHAIENMVASTIDNLMLDADWLSKIENVLKQHLAQSVMSQLRSLDVERAISGQMDSYMDRWQEHLRENFSSRGIRDDATDTQLTVMDDGIVASKGIAAQELYIEKDAKINGALVVDNLAVLRNINVDCPGWNTLIEHVADKTLGRVNENWRVSLVQEVLDLAKTQGIDFAQIHLQGQPLVVGDRLNPAVKTTSIERTGVLSELTVSGTVNLNDSVRVINRRLGVNTDNPEMALSVWDEEVSVIVGKIEKQRAYIGTGRLQSLAIGINRVPQIEITAEGLTTIKQLCIGRHRISHADQVPGYSGTKGDVVFNSNPRAGEPFAWQCLGGFQWQPLKAA